MLESFCMHDKNSPYYRPDGAAAVLDASTFGELESGYMCCHLGRSKGPFGVAEVMFFEKGFCLHWCTRTV